MALVVFLRGVNVGRHKRFLPSQLAKDLSALDVVNVGAAGTFVVRASVTQATLLAEVRTRLAFDADILIVKGTKLIELARSTPFGRRPPAVDQQRFLSVTQKPLATPALPLFYPAGKTWQVKVVVVSGNLVASIWRRRPGAPIYPNTALEKQFGIATTRNWNTVDTICKILEP